MPQADADAAPRYVFVYGTLRAGGSNDIRRFVPAPELVGEASIFGLLYDLGAYPGMVLGGPSRVRGEVYRIAPRVEAALDELEEVADDDSGEYIKREIAIAIAVAVGGCALPCLVYEIQPSRVVERAVIASGDWLDHLISRKKR